MFTKNLILFNLFKHFNFESRYFLSSYALQLTKTGEPSQVIKKVDITEEVLKRKLKDYEVLLQCLASPVNPADLFFIRGTYGIAAKIPTYLGIQGVAKVIKSGALVKRVKINDLVVLNSDEFGTWSTHLIRPQSALFKVDNDMNLFDAAQLTSNPPTAYRMMKDFVDLKPGDSLLQNGANSACGTYVIQLAREWGIKSINVIRKRSDPKDTEMLKAELMEYGADFVVTDQDLRQKEVMNEIWSKGIPKPKLVLDCIGGQIASDCIRHLDEDGTMITYGGMSRQRLVVPVGPFLFNNLKFVSFWLHRWILKHTSEEFEAILQELVTLFTKGKLKSPKVIPVELDDYKRALELADSPFSKGKVIFTMNH